jgi:hypothetical protein
VLKLHHAQRTKSSNAPTTRRFHTTCRGGACPARVQLETRVEMSQVPRKNVIPSEARNLLFLCGANRAPSYSEGSGGSAGTVEGLGGIAGLDGATGLGADAGLLCEAAFPTVRYLRILSSRFGPMPRTARKSSTLLNAPYDLRICKILSAVTGPIPGTDCNSSDVAVFKLTGASGGFFFATRAGEIAQNATTRRAIRARRCRNIME